MTPMNENTPAAGQGNEGNESFGDPSMTTAYIAYPADNTRDTLGTWGDGDLPRAGHITVIIPLSAARKMTTVPQLVQINAACVEAQKEERRKQKEERRKQELEKTKCRIASRVWDEFDAELEAIEKQRDELQARVEAKVQATFDALAAKRGDGQ